jgi:hypothetical protein
MCWCATVLQRATRTKAAAAARSDGAIYSSIRKFFWDAMIFL